VAFLIKTIVYSQVVVIIFIIINLLIEFITKARGFYYHFNYEKNLVTARAAALFCTIIYLIINFLTFIYFWIKTDIIPHYFSFWEWLIFMIPLLIIVNRSYYKFTKKNPDINNSQIQNID